MAERVDRDEVFLELTRSICPLCTRVIDGEVNARANRVVIRKRCPEHGEFEALVSSEAEADVAQRRFNKPGTLPLALQTDVHDGRPLDCGICPQHKQHACLGIIEVHSGCILDCPVCFADSNRRHPDDFSTLPDALPELHTKPVFIRHPGAVRVNTGLDGAGLSS